MSSRFFFKYIGCAIILYALWISHSGCAQIGSPTGGPKDTIAPKLISSYPTINSVNVSTNKVVLNFNEYVDVKDAQTNVLVSPYPKTNPIISYKLKTVTIKLQDTLMPNTTYSINFGNAIQDVNEGNPFKNFTYVFSTGNTIDTLQLHGKVIIAETGKTDSTLIAMLYKNTVDSAVQKRKPDYMAKLNGQGEFSFANLSKGSYKLYALKDGDGGKTYNSATELFAFLNKEIEVNKIDTTQIILNAFAQEKDTKNSKTILAKTGGEKKLKFTTSLENNQQDLIKNLNIYFNKPLKEFDNKKIILLDTNYKPIANTTVSLDTTQKNVLIKTKWLANNVYYLIINKDAIADSIGNKIAKTDTIHFKTKAEDEYGSLKLRFTNLNLSKHPVMQFVQAEEIKKSVVITAIEWSDILFPPGDYDIRILYDTNNDGKWTPGNYSKKVQPEKAVTLEPKLTIKANWDNEREINL